MRSRPKYEKLGLLVLLVIIASIMIGFLLGIRTDPTVTFHTYFDETVQGLESGAFVKYRGMRIGSVGSIKAAPDDRHIHVTLEIDRERARELALDERATDMRARLAIIGITGLKLVDLEPAGPDARASTLPFPTPTNYIPARRSMVAELEGVAGRVGDKLPLLIDRALVVLERVEALAGDMRTADLASRIGTAADRVASVAGDLRHTVRRLDRSAVPAAAKLKSILDRIDGPKGLLASARRASESFRDAGATFSGVDLERTLREMRDAARAIRMFFQDLARQPDMILKGRAR